MPPLNEGDVMYMPVTDPAISIDEALRVMQMQDRMLKSFPEVEWVVGQGRPRGNFDRPRAGEHERDDRSSETNQNNGAPG